jgi:hypothetical protein
MKEYEKLSIACPSCLGLIELNSKECKECGVVLTDDERLYLSMASEGVYYFGWQYGIPFYYEYQETGQIKSRFCLTPNEILSYLASVIAAGVIGNFTYDLIKGSAFRVLKKLQSKKEINFVIDPNKSEEQQFDLLFKLAEGYIEYKKTPFPVLNRELSEVFSTIEQNEPGKFLSPGLIVELKKIYFKYSKTISEEETREIEEKKRNRNKLDYLKFVYIMRLNLLGKDVSNEIIRYLAEEEYELASSLLEKKTDFNTDEVYQYLNGPSLDRITRPINVILELIENSILALQNTPDAKLTINISGKRVSIEDNGPGMSPETVFDHLLIPWHVGWVKNGILTDCETFHRIGVGFTASLIWCNRVIVETKAKDFKPISVELAINNENDMKLFGHQSDVTKMGTGTRIKVELSQPFRTRWYAVGPGCKINWHQDNFDLTLVGLIRSYCRLVNKRIAIIVNGEIINDEKRRGFGPKVVSFKLNEKLYRNKLSIPIYVMPITEEKNDLDYYGGRTSYDGFKCIFEFYQNGLFLFHHSLEYSEKRNLSEYQKSRLNNFIIRVFLPGHFMLLNSKLGLPYMSEAYIIEQVLDLVSLYPVQM